MKQFLIADTHISHKQIIEYEARPFTDYHEMNEFLVQCWNSVVSKNDTVYHVGDLYLYKPYDYIERLNGNIILIRGNHDDKTTGHYKKLGIKAVFDYFVIEDCVLTHRPLIWTNNRFNIHGHTHSFRENDDSHFCVSVEMINYTPILLEKVLAYKNKHWGRKRDYTTIPNY